MSSDHGEPANFVVPAMTGRRIARRGSGVAWPRRVKSYVRRAHGVLDPVMVMVTAIGFTSAVVKWVVPDPSVPLAPLTGEFNIAVAPFRQAQVGDAGDVNSSILEAQTAGFVETLSSQLSSDAVFDVDVAVRELRADIRSPIVDLENEARSISAQVLVFAIFRYDGTNTWIEPWAYVSARGLPQVQESAGLSSLGETPRVIGSLESADAVLLSNLRGMLTSRAVGAAHLMLAAWMIGRADYERAQHDLDIVATNEAETIVPLEEQLQANVALGRGDYDEAESRYGRILEADPGFGRAMLGLAEVERLRAVASDGCAGDKHQAHNDQAREWLDWAAAAENVLGGFVIEKAVIERVQVVLCGETASAEEMRRLDQVIDSLRNTRLDDSLLAHALNVRAQALSMATDSAQLLRSIDDFVELQTLPISTAVRGLAQWRLGEVYAAAGMTAEATQTLEVALSTFLGLLQTADTTASKQLADWVDFVQKSLDRVTQAG